jgi:hypothetical protein
MNDDSEPSLTKYVVQFAGGFILLGAVLVVVSTLLNVQLPSSVTFGILIGATGYPVFNFVKTEQRLMEPHERARFALWATLVNVAVLIPIFLGVCALDHVSPMDFIAASGVSLGEALFVAIFALVLTWVPVYFAAGMFGKVGMKQLDKAK